MTQIDIQTILSQHPLGLVFDIDGTLSPIMPTPDAASLYPGVASLLEQVRNHAHVAIMTGRGLADGARIVNVDGLTYIGTHGMEWCDGLPATHPISIVPEALPYVEPGKRLLALVEQQLPSLPGVIVQYKSVGGTIHYRNTPNPEQARERILTILEEPARAEHMHLGEGKMVVEVLAPIAVNKGQALLQFAQHFDLRGLVFAGDDRTDLYAVLAAEQLRQQGIATLSIVVRYADTLPELLEHADIVVDGVEGMVQLMREMVDLIAS